ncbi:MAG: NAD-glutamate dehydrogenase [Alphaproteobacteria bacterium]
MATRLHDQKEDLLSGAVARLHDKLDKNQACLGEAFLRHYYRSVAPVDVVDRDALDLYGAALAHLRFAEQREPGEAKVRVYNPQIEQHGWQSTHTTIEIVIDDMPFLVDSITMAINRLGLIIHLIIHPVLPVVRGEGHGITAIGAPDGNGGGVAESFMHIEVDRQSDPARLEEIRDTLLHALADVRAAVDDWRSMLGKIDDALDDLGRAAKVVPEDELAEVRAFLEWIAANHFTFIGYRCYELATVRGKDQLHRVPGSALGILRHREDGKISESFAVLPDDVKRQARLPAPLMITKANSRSTVHRPVYLDYIGVKRFDKKGKVIGEHRFLGLFTSAAYNRNPRDIPLLRHKVRRLIERADLVTSSHAGKAFINILETYPRDELLQSDEEELFDTVMETLHLQERQRIRLFARKDAFARFVSCLVYVPRERYNTELRRRFQDILEEALGGRETEYQVQVSESTLARIHFIVRTFEGLTKDVELAAIEAQLIAAARSWSDGLRAALIDVHGEEEGNRLFGAFGSAFPISYQEQVPSRAAVPDVDRLNVLAAHPDELALSLFRPLENGLLRFKIARKGGGIPLSDALPILENMGLRVIDEQPYELVAKDGSIFWMHDFGMRPTETVDVKLERVGKTFQETFEYIWKGEVENDGFNQMVLFAGLTSRQILVLRAYCKYLLQIGIPFSQAYMEQTLSRNPELARLLAELFDARFDPAAGKDRDSRVATLETRIREGLEAVANLDEDRILRRYMRLILATLRTNHYQRAADGAYKPYLSLKIDPAEVPEMPLPRPAYEIFVYSPRAEGVHLRGGKVARGGIRWSDRREDFRTEVLGLMKAQMVKNGVIVPVGAKGGFVVKRPPRDGDRAALQEEVIACYKILISGMLDLTDNRTSDGITPPPDVVRHDEDDPYLVVAADKGTATFSDIANQVSLAYGHWLGDAFASGGSAGYDHKGMGITARGAWESVKRHFLEMGKDCQTEVFTAVGVGDMSGDVFGNGMLLSEKTALIAAFDHRHIFIDPKPDVEAGFAERKRLFELPRSSWDDYDRGRISAGGGVFPRTLKSIKLTPEIRAALAVEADSLTPHDLIRAILLAPVELFWNGGIGTYVKASTERHADAFDRTNDPVRVNGRELRCQIVGEGGNLGLTQRGRIEFAQKGGRINTDFIDNSAGVDCSDHEVNIKILLGAVVDAGDMTGKQRDQLLSRMTDEVAELVLRNNILQVQAISQAQAHPGELLDTQAAFMRRLEAGGRLNRELELLPDDEVLTQRRQAGQGLYRPEIAVILAYAKMTLYEDLLGSDLPDDPYLHQDLVKYFPRPLRKSYEPQIADHRLRREIVATLVANSIVNRGLGEFVGDLVDQTGATPATIARAYIVARDAFSLVPLIGQLEQLAGLIGAERQIALLDETRRSLTEGTHWFLSNLQHPIDTRGSIERFQHGITELLETLDQVLGEEERGRLEQAQAEYRSQGMVDKAAAAFARLPYCCAAAETVAVARETGVAIVDAAKVYFALDSALQLGRVLKLLQRVAIDNHWDRLAIAELHDDIVEEHRRLATQALTSRFRSPNEELTPADIQRKMLEWLAAEVTGYGRWQRLLAEMEGRANLDLAVFLVAVRALGRLNAVVPKAA